MKEVKMQFLDSAYIGDFLFRYLHILVGITWIGLLYYFNLVQVPALAAYGDEGKARMLTLDKVARRALWWFSYASLATLCTGLLMTGIIENYWTRSSATQNIDSICEHDFLVLPNNHPHIRRHQGADRHAE